MKDTEFMARGRHNLPPDARDDILKYAADRATPPLHCRVFQWPEAYRQNRLGKNDTSPPKGVISRDGKV